MMGPAGAGAVSLLALATVQDVEAANAEVDCIFGLLGRDDVLWGGERATGIGRRACGIGREVEEPMENEEDAATWPAEGRSFASFQGAIIEVVSFQGAIAVIGVKVEVEEEEEVDKTELLPFVNEDERCTRGGIYAFGIGRGEDGTLDDLVMVGVGGARSVVASVVVVDVVSEVATTFSSSTAAVVTVVRVADSVEDTAGGMTERDVLVSSTATVRDRRFIGSGSDV